MKKFFFSFLFLFFLFSIYGFSGTEKCPLKGKEIVKEEEGVFQGKILCAHCDLHKKEKCQNVFVDQNGKIFEICPDCLQDIKIENFKGKDIKISGKVKYSKEGSPVLCIKEISLIDK